eukprot:scaffold1404_cov166-Amphora_coffeaeformis.AAC.4
MPGDWEKAARRSRGFGTRKRYACASKSPMKGNGRYVVLKYNAATNSYLNGGSAIYQEVILFYTSKAAYSTI